MTNHSKGILASALIIFLLVSFFGGWRSAQASTMNWQTLYSLPNKIDPTLRKTLNQLQSAEPVTVIVTLRQRADLSRLGGRTRAERRQNLILALKNTSNATQGPLRIWLQARLKEGRIQKFESLWVINGFSVTTTADVIDQLAQNPNVLSITPDAVDITPDFAIPEINVTNVKAPSLWGLGYTGQGIVVASMDTGVDVSHPDLSSRWRGGTNSWFDPYGQHPSTPTDLSGHGTWTMGVMIGGDAGGSTIGVAPGAQWISVKIFNDAGSSTATAIHQGFQWLLDPDGNLNTDDAPAVVNNSWTYSSPGCNLDFEFDLQALRAAGILPVFAAGNYGSLSNTSRSPANNPSAFPVGNLNDNNLIYNTSSRGPSACSGWTGPYPKIVAPGVTIHTTDLFNGYFDPTGTSLAAPHVAGSLALLLSANPNLSAADQENALINSAFDLGASGPDNIYGYGRLDILAALNLLGSIPSSTPPPADTATSMPTLTATPGSTATAAPTFTSTPANTSTPLPTTTSMPSNTPTALPTFTSTPTNTAQPSPTFTSTATAVSATTMHVGDLDRSSTNSGTKWNAVVTILVHNNLEQPLSNATLTGNWTNGATGTVTCTTNSSGLCSVTKTGLATKTTSITFTVTNVTKSALVYKSTSNHDPDGESSGTTIVVANP